MLEDQELWNSLCEIAGSDNVRRQEPMKKHTTFRIGGPADYFVVPHSREEIRQAIEVCRSFKVPCYILGNGSNLLVGDKGYREWSSRFTRISAALKSRARRSMWKQERSLNHGEESYESFPGRA